MHLSKVRVSNFRRLSNVIIDLANDISIFVGANNSGKTSVAQAMHLFLTGAREKLTFHDISASKWADIEAFSRGEEGAELPKIELDLWFEVQAHNLHRVIDLLPSLEWEGTYVGVRISFRPANGDETLARFQQRHQQAQQAAAIVFDGEGEVPEDGFVASPKNLTEYLEGEIKREYEFRYFVLDAAQCNDELELNEGYQPLELLRDQGRTGRDIVNSLIKIDFLHAQRHLSDTSGGSRTEELSRHLSRYYARNLEKHADDFSAIRALAQSEMLLNTHLEQVFSETLDQLAILGYPGFSNPRMVIKSALNPATIMNSQDGTHVHYALGEGDLTLPDKHNGLGFKNLIYMVVELLDLHAQWLAIEENRPSLHLVFVEEPEAHLHAQLQQVFVNKVLNILAEEDAEEDAFKTQLVLSTHSPHILYERGFRPIRYFRREGSGLQQSTSVLNLSEFYQRTANPSRDFLERYLKLTHCDLFFADAAILVEGNVERLLMPQMIQKSAPGLKSTYLSILEIGGAFGDRFQTLIEFLGMRTLVITDLDSVFGPNLDGDIVNIDILDEVDDGGDAEEAIPGKTCRPEVDGAVTSNQMLINWLPARTDIQELLSLPADEKVAHAGGGNAVRVRVTYPSTVELVNGEERLERAGRTLEAAFAYENLEWTQQLVNRDLRLRIANPGNLVALANRLHKRIHGDSFKKTDFALALLGKNEAEWQVPAYILEGLQWLEAELDVAEPAPVAPEGIVA